MKALLLLVGGRPIPNVLTVIHEEPEVIIAICSIESVKREWLDLKPAIERLLPLCPIEEPSPVDAFDIVKIQETCEDQLRNYPDADWIFNVTTATSLMTLGAYKAAESYRSQQKKSIKCWYLNTANTRVIPLVDEDEIDEDRDKRIFSITVDQYVMGHNYNLLPGNLNIYQACYLQDTWITIAKRLGRNPQEAYLLKQIMKEVEKTGNGSPGRANKGQAEIFKGGYKVEKCVSNEAYSLLKELETVGILKKLRQDSVGLHFTLSERRYKFLNGAWLEMYVYETARELAIFDNYEWHQEIIDTNPERSKKSSLRYNELDVSMTYKAQLLIAECKTGKAGLETETLDDLVTIADLLGGKFVGKIVVTNQSSSDDRNPNDTDEQKAISYKNFLTKADRKGIYVVTREDLPDLRKTLYELATDSKYSGR